MKLVILPVLLLLLAGCTVDSGDHGQVTSGESESTHSAVFPNDYLLSSYPMSGSWELVTDEDMLAAFDMDSNPDELEDQGCENPEECPDSTHMALLHDAANDIYGISMAAQYKAASHASTLAKMSCDEDDGQSAFASGGSTLMMFYASPFGDAPPADSLAAWDSMVSATIQASGSTLHC